MHSPDALVVEDCEGLESEMERLFIIYGYPVETGGDHLRNKLDGDLAGNLEGDLMCRKKI